MLLWDIDRSLRQLVDLYGFERAVRAYQASHGAAGGLIRLDFAMRRGLRSPAPQCAVPVGGRRRRRSLGRVGLAKPRRPSDCVSFLARPERAFRHSAARRDPVAGAADADPAALAAGLLDVALGRGAQLRNGEATAFDSRASKVTIGFADGFEAEAQYVVLATGYVMPAVVHARVQQASSSWAIATAPQPENLWPEQRADLGSHGRLSLCAHHRGRPHHLRRRRRPKPRPNPRKGTQPIAAKVAHSWRRP